MNLKNADELLKSKGIKSTPNRILVLRELLKASHPMSIANLEDSIGFSMDKASIFRVLELFAARNIVHVIEDGSRSLKYEMCRNDGVHNIADQHPHFYCEICKETYCLDNIKSPVVETPEGFITHSVNYLLKGTCPKCNNQTTD
ncbi:MAG: transcriptional repressor [Candidatus Amulumruptor caecigallinarius]|nr:transcriptional repressor [Candidatus Amulumruptor caecigallinarius]